ncbi:cytochrome c553 [Luteibacter sp. OK325]|jgi:cytochrome c553|uniref:c-type cytochrome n=1 Tax=Luteibacter sp. OK325 TaxID=2135670 RepID=UPI000D388A9C|nr:c-type cytochrome [Luteibacter sp. OK325]PTR29902.1 cytochrome c553 [Luteibacter sp. OK325]
MRRLFRRLAVIAAVLCAMQAMAADTPPVPDTLVQRIAACTSCHGEHGEGGSNGFNPRLAGKPAGYLHRQMQDFQRGLRHYPIMEYTVGPLTDGYMREIAEYFSAQEVPYTLHDVPATSPAAMARGEQLVTKGDTARGVPACMACHGPNLTGVQPDIPGLVGLPYDYISAQLGSWRTNTRNTVAPDCMKTIVGHLSDADISAVSAWLAQRPVPADAHAEPAGSVSPPLRCGVLGGGT